MSPDRIQGKMLYQGFYNLSEVVARPDDFGGKTFGPSEFGKFDTV